MSELKSNITFTPVADPVYVHALGAPVSYGSSNIAEIPFRKPSGRDLLFIGSPVISDPTSDREARLDFAIVYRLASALSGLPEKIFLDQVDPGEMIELGWRLSSFFMQGYQGLLPAMQKSKDPSSDPPEPPAS